METVSAVEGLDDKVDERVSFQSAGPKCAASWAMNGKRHQARLWSSSAWAEREPGESPFEELKLGAQFLILHLEDAREVKWI